MSKAGTNRVELEQALDYFAETGDTFWPGCAQKAKRGLEICGFAAVIYAKILKK